MSASTAQHHVSGGMLASLRFTWRWAALALASLSLSLIAACLPVGFGFHYIGNCVDGFEVSNVKVESGVSIAFADAPQPTTAATSFLIDCARAAGLTPTEYVCALSGAVTMATGMELGREAGIELGNTVPENLSNLVDAADYPDWETLDTSQKEAWGDKTMYDAAKFNSLLKGFGYGDVAQSYYDNFMGSGGGNVDLGQDLIDSLKQVGRIGKRWAMGLGNTYESVAGLFADREALYGYFGSDNPGAGFAGASYSGWPSNFPGYIEIGSGSVQVVTTSNGTQVYNVLIWASDSPVWIMSFYDYYRGRDDIRTYYVFMFSESPFLFASKMGDNYNPSVPSVTPSNSARHRVVSDSVDYYYSGYNYIASGKDFVSTFPFFRVVSPNGSQLDAMDIIMASGGPVANRVTPTVSGYPENEPDPDEELYYPEQGLNTYNTWNTYTTPTPVVTPENPFNPGNETATDDWKDDAEANTVNLSGVHFDKLFPFCLLADIGLLFNKMQSLGILPQVNGTIGNGDLSTQGNVTDNSSAYLHVMLPISGFDPSHDYIQDGEQIDFDLVPLHDLLILIRPAVQILLVVVLLFTLIDFWRGVLAG